MERFARSLALARASIAVLLGDKQLLLFTVLSAVFTAMAAVVLALPGFFIMSGGQLGDASGASSTPPPATLVLWFAFYLVVSFVTIFFNTALIGCALDRMRGGNATFWDGFDVASRNVGHIFVYALITATVGLLLRMIEGRFRFASRLVGALLNGAWAIVTFLVIPVMVAEDVNPLVAIQRSGQLLKKTWGEQIIGNAGIGLVFFLLALLAAIPVTLGALAANSVAFIAGTIVAGVYLLVIFLVSASVDQIYRAAVYHYAQSGSVTAPFEGWMLSDAFRSKQTNSPNREI
jgi:hypothetical protein